MKYPIWNESGIFYVLNLNGITKFGITQNFENRMKSYVNEYQRSGRLFNGKLCYAEEYKEFWKLEFVETMLRRKLYPFIVFW